MLAFLGLLNAAADIVRTPLGAGAPGGTTGELAVFRDVFDLVYEGDAPSGRGYSNGVRYGDSVPGELVIPFCSGRFIPGGIWAEPEV